jgi:alkanesulfonate monooxygenase SsuD/methylene tetrahydromethanopterin reductase-like flavin-dependent oxidoreductase (luciferase family)
MPTTEPFAKNGVSLRLYPHNELDAAGVIDEICAQAKLGLDHGFDGIMTSEHHGGFGGYFGNPLQLTTFFLEENPNGWAAPCPLLLPLRPTVSVAEDVAWLAARHPGRVGLGVGSGAAKLDFDSMGVPLEESVPRFKTELPRIIDMLQGKDLRGLEADRAFQRCAEHPVPVLSTSASPAASRRAAACGAGILMEGMSPVERLAKFCAAYDEAGGTGCKMLIRRVWLGEPNAELIEKQRDVYRSISSSGGNPPRAFGDDQTVSSEDADELAQRLHDIVRAAGGDAINLRLHLPHIPAGAIREQIVRVGDEVVPKLRALLAASST